MIGLLYMMPNIVLDGRVSGTNPPITVHMAPEKTDQLDVETDIRDRLKASDKTIEVA